MNDEKKMDETTLKNRRSVLKMGGMAVAAGAASVAAAATLGTTPAHAQSGGKGQSILDKIKREKKVRVGCALYAPPMGFKDPKTGKATGYTIEVIRMVLQDIVPGLEIDFQDMPLSQVFPALQAGKIDLSLPVTNTPQRSLRGWFSSMPLKYDPVYLVVSEKTSLTTKSNLNASGIRFAVYRGSAQEQMAKLLYPKAKIASFPGQAEAINEVVSGRAQVTLQSLFTVVNAIKQGVKIKPLGDIAYLDPSCQLLPEGDMPLWMYITNSLRFHAGRGKLKSMYMQWVGNDALKVGLSPIVVGVNGMPEVIKA